MTPASVQTKAGNACPRCQFINPDDSRFCENCGQQVTRACPDCGTPASPNARFCRNCGHSFIPADSLSSPSSPAPLPPSEASSHAALPSPEPTSDILSRFLPKEYVARLEAAAARASRAKTSGTGMEGERRIVTVLFCDVKGSTAMAESLDPEEWAEIMNGAFEFLIAPVYRYEGTLARLMGDAVLAFFGAPLAHEDDPQRAVLAGLEIIRGIQPYRQQMKAKFGLDFNLRVGINTGLVVVGEVGSDLRVEYTAMGDGVNLAARMEQTAQPGTVQISGNTHKLIAPLFDTESLGGIEVKGKTEPVPAYRVLGTKAAPGRLRGIEGLESPLIGREKETSALQNTLAQLRAGRGQIVSVMGEAGLGKSRLVAEVRQSPVSNLPSPLSWHEGRSLSYETQKPYAPFIDLLRGLFGFQSEENDAARYERVKSSLAEAMPEKVAEAAPLIGALLGIRLSGEDAERVIYLEPPVLQGRTFQAIAEFFERMAGLAPTALVFEDLHWADATSLALIEQLIPITDRAPLMLLALFRPQRHEPSWKFHETGARDFPHRYSALTLEPLDEAHSRQLVANLLEIEDLPEKVRGLILARAEGNPFFVEEVIRSLLDAKLVVRDNSHWRATKEIETIAVPDTLAGVIIARLDRLDEDSRRVAQTASVVGREFLFEILSEVADDRSGLDDCLGNLQRRELVREKSRLPQRAYLFKHVLTQETAYASMLLSRRRELHRRVGECLEKVDADRVTDIARHFLEARESARALPYLVEAGTQAARAYATPQAIGHFTRALEIVQTVENLEAARRSYEGLGAARMLSNDIQGALDAYEAMFKYAEARGNIPMQVSALNKFALNAVWLGKFKEIEESLGRAEQLAREYEDRVGMAELYWARCSLATMTADFGMAVKYLGESVQIGRDLNLMDQMAFGLEHMSNTLVYMTRFDEAWQTVQEGLSISRNIGHRLHEAALLAFPAAMVHLRNGQIEKALESAEEGAALGAKIGAAMPECEGLLISGMVSLYRGEYERALASLSRGLQAGRETGYLMFEAILLAQLGFAYSEVSSSLLDRAVEYHTPVLKMLENPAGMPAGGFAWADMGFCVLAAGKPEQAAELFQKALEVPTPFSQFNRPRFHVGEALVALARAQTEEAERAVVAARDFAEERKMKYHYPLIALTAGKVHAARGETEAALDEFAIAESLALEMTFRPTAWKARAGAAQVLAAAGRIEEAEARRSGARAMIDEIAGLFENEDLRGKFLEGALKQVDGYS